MPTAISHGPSSKSATRKNTVSRSATTLSDHPIARRWRAIRAEGRRAALIPYLTAGYPTPAACVAALRLAEAAGADFVAAGAPFSDPPPDGPTLPPSTPTSPTPGSTAARGRGLGHQAPRRA